MPNSELITLWNSILDFKISENCLSKPDEQFIFKALISLLRLFNYDTELMLQKINNEDNESKRLFKIEFCRIVQKLYKISDNSHTFVYYDLIKPTPKKTYHLLKCLLNYHLFCNMFRQEIFSKVDKKIQELENIQKIKTRNQIENEHVEIKANMIDQKLTEYDKVLPKLDEKIAELIAKKQIYGEEIEKYEETAKNYEDLILELQSKEKKLRNKVVSSEEAESLLSKKVTLETALKDQKEIERITRESNQEIYITNEKLEKDVKYIESVIETYFQDPNEFTSSKNLKSKMQQLLNNLEDQKIKNEKITNEIELLEKKINETNADLKEKNVLSQKRLFEYKKELSEKNEMKSNAENLNDNLNDAIHELETEMMKQQNNREFMLKSSEQIYKIIFSIPSELSMGNSKI